MSKKVNAIAEKIYLVQQEQADVLVFILDAPSTTPSDPDTIPIMLIPTEAGHGGVWLKKAFDLQPDEVIDRRTDLSKFDAVVSHYIRRALFTNNFV